MNSCLMHMIHYVLLLHMVLVLKIHLYVTYSIVCSTINLSKLMHDITKSMCRSF